MKKSILGLGVELSNFTSEFFGPDVSQDLNSYSAAAPESYWLKISGYLRQFGLNEGQSKEFLLAARYQHRTHYSNIRAFSDAATAVENLQRATAEIGILSHWQGQVPLSDFAAQIGISQPLRCVIEISPENEPVENEPVENEPVENEPVGDGPAEDALSNLKLSQCLRLPQTEQSNSNNFSSVALVSCDSELLHWAETQNICPVPIGLPNWRSKNSPLSQTFHLTSLSQLIDSRKQVVAEIPTTPTRQAA